MAPTLTWEDGAQLAANQIVRDFDISKWLRTPQETIGLLNDQIEELVTNYYNAPLYARSLIADRFIWIGRNVLGGWIHESNDTIDSHITYVVRTLISKHLDYGSRGVSRFGVRGILVRLADKHARLENLYKHRDTRMADNEPIEDTWLDLLGYTLLALMLLDDTFGLPMKADT